MRQVICRGCGIEFETIYHNKAFCSSPCYKTYTLKKNKEEREAASKAKRQKICSYCGKQFTAKSALQAYCSDECKDIGTKERKKEWYYNNKRSAEIGSTINCDVCGKKFVVTETGCTCCSPICKKILSDKEYSVSAVHGEGFRYVVYRPKKNINKSLDEKIAEAKRLGISYGQYQARLVGA